jgi:dihydropyrimidinase
MASSPPKKLPIHLQSSQNRLLIKNGRIVNDDSIFDADIFIENGLIAQIGHNLVVPGGVRVIDARASSPNEVNYVIPGGIDSHTHLNAKFMNANVLDDYYNGSRAAVAGGTTTFINFAMTSKESPSLIEAFERERKLADGQVCCDYAIHVVVSDWIEGRTEYEIAKLVNEHGVNSFKIFLCYAMQLNDRQIINVMSTCAKYGAVVIAHCENGDIIEYNANNLAKLGLMGPESHLLSRPECIEAEATHRISVLSEQVRCPVMVAHVMSKSAAKVIVDERARNSSLFGETLAAAIGTDGTNYYHKCWRHAAGHIMSPPLRPDRSTPEYLLGTLASGSLQVLGSDHCVYGSAQKEFGKDDFRKIPNGINGIEERMLIAWERGVRGGFLDPCKFVAVTSTNAAKLFNLYPRKGRIQVGSDADLVIWGRNVKVISAKEQVSKGDFNIFEGARVESGPLVVVVQGRVAFDNTGLHVVQGSGRFLARQPFPLTAYGPLRIKNRLIPMTVDRSQQDDESVAEIEKKVENVHLMAAGQRPGGPTQPDDPEDGFYHRTSKNGVRNMQDSTFKLSGEQVGDKQNRSNIRVSGQPPGGKSSGLW